MQCEGGTIFIEFSSSLKNTFSKPQPVNLTRMGKVKVTETNESIYKVHLNFELTS